MVTVMTAVRKSVPGGQTSRKVRSTAAECHAAVDGVVRDQHAGVGRHAGQPRADRVGLRLIDPRCGRVRAAARGEQPVLGLAQRVKPRFRQRRGLLEPRNAGLQTWSRAGGRSAAGPA